jgi:hypothetical protein
MRALIMASAICGAALAMAARAQATETITYGYDPRGRLVEVKRVVNSAAPVVTTYQLDKADNRTSKTTTGSPNPPPP